jgi:glycosyltransferase involved in cell wall biosynthesis
MPKSVTFVAQGLSGGGAEMSMLRLAEDLRRNDYDVRIAVLWKTGRLADALPEGIRVDEVGGGRVSCIPRLARYLARNRSDAVIGFMTYANVVAILAQALSPSLRKIVVTEHNTYSRSIKIRGGIPKLFHLAAPYAYRWASTVVCVSRGVEDDLAETTRLPRRLLTTIYNPVISDALIAQSEEPPDHPWLVEKTLPVILAVGRLEKQKNYPLLLESFARLRNRVACRLLVLGEGELIEELRARATHLGIEDYVDFAGYRSNAMSFMRQADLFVLSSDFEGLSNVLIEAMAVGCPVVSTDAPHGPREVLQEGRLGQLVPVGDVDGLARAMEETLRNPGDAELRQRWAMAFSVRASADQYLRVAGLQ